MSYGLPILLNQSTPRSGGSDLSDRERQALAFAYVVCRGAGFIRHGGALEAWARRDGGGNLEPLAALFGAIVAGHPETALGTLANLRFKDPAVSGKVRALTRQLASVCHPTGKPTPTTSFR